MTVIKRILALEPVAVQGVVRLVFVLLATVGVTVSDEVSGQALAFIAAAYALVEGVTTLWARSKVRPDATVVTPGLTDHETLHLARVHDDLPEDDEARPVIESVLYQARHMS